MTLWKNRCADARAANHDTRKSRDQTAKAGAGRPVRAPRGVFRTFVQVRLAIVAGMAVAALSGGAAAAAEQRYRLDPDHTFAHFAVLHTGVSSVHGRMGIRNGRAMLDPANELATIDVELDPRSIDTGVKKLDAVLVDEMFFHVTRYKSAHFTGRAVAFREGVPWEFDGQLTLRGITRPVHLTARHFVCKQVKIMVLERYVCGGDLQAVLKRSDFGLDKYSTMISDDVRLTISVEAIREDR